MIFLSLVRANAEGNIGFLGDLRRINVAITRARMKLIIYGDTSTLIKNPFYKAFIEFIRKNGRIEPLSPEDADREIADKEKSDRKHIRPEATGKKKFAQKTVHPATVGKEKPEGETARKEKPEKEDVNMDTTAKADLEKETVGKKELAKEVVHPETTDKAESDKEAVHPETMDEENEPDAVTAENRNRSLWSRLMGWKTT